LEHDLNLGCSHSWAEDEDTMMRGLNLYFLSGEATKTSNLEKQILNYFEM
jgi:hypothetical protein